jgi:hypothetical protein
MEYTVEIYRRDARRKTGEKLVLTIDYKDVPKEGVERYCLANYSLPKYRFEIHETWVVKKNLLSGEEFKERYDTPYYCSPSSETYWSM